MAQLSLYFTDATMQRLRADAKASNTSISKYVSSLVTNAKMQEGWPTGYWDTVYGALDDPTFVVPSEPDPCLDGAIPAFSEE